MERLIAAQRDLHGHIARTYENLKKSGTAKLTPELVQSTLSVLETRWAKFEAQHDKLYAESGTELRRHEYFSKDFVSQVEDIYAQQRATILELEKSLTTAAPVAEARVEETRVSSRTTLPRIQLPQFSGKYEEWPAFRDLFRSIVSRDKAAAPVEKLHYLRTCLKGEATDSRLA